MDQETGSELHFMLQSLIKRTYLVFPQMGKRWGSKSVLYSETNCQEKFRINPGLV